MPIFRVILFFVLCSNFSSAQETLEIMYTRFGSFKNYKIHINEVFDYKLKGERRFHSGKIIAMSDSTLLFSNYDEVKLSQLKSVRFKKNNHLITIFSKAFLIAGVGFILLDTFNNIILNRPTVVNEKAVVISAALLSTSFLLKRMSYKRVRTGKHKILRIVNFNYQNLSVPN